MASLGGVALYPTTDPSVVLSEESPSRSCAEPWLWLSLTTGAGACVRDCSGSRERSLGFWATLRLALPSGRTIELPATVVAQESGQLTIGSEGPPVVHAIGQREGERWSLTVVLSSPAGSATFVDDAPGERSVAALVLQERRLGVQELLDRLSFEPLLCRRSGAELLTRTRGAVRLTVRSRASSPCDGGGERVTVVVDGVEELGHIAFDSRMSPGSFGRHREGQLESARGLTVMGTTVTGTGGPLLQRLGCARTAELHAELGLRVELWPGQPATATLTLVYGAPACETSTLECSGSGLEAVPQRPE